MDKGMAFKRMQDAIQYKKHLMKSNHLTLKFSTQNKDLLLRECFWALANYKEKKKHSIMKQALTSDMDVALEAYSKENERVK